MFEEINEAHNIVWGVRRQLEKDGSSFKTPTTKRTAYYIRSELNEAFDIWMRESDPSEARNNVRKDTLTDECADALMMMLTLLGDAILSERTFSHALEEWVSAHNDNLEQSLNHCFKTAEAVIDMIDYDEPYLQLTMEMTVALCAIRPDCIKRVPYRLAKLIAKNSPFLSKASALAIADGSAYMDVEMSNKIQAEKTAWLDKWDAIIGRKIQKMIDAETLRDYQNSLIIN